MVVYTEKMAHLTFYRKYRSRTFDEIVGQEHIIQTLKNAILHDRLAQAYIFSGPRGTGKTSTARILAKALNCRSGKTVTPCLTCDLCTKINRGNAVDVIELDAASHTGVDNIRVLNEQINFQPVECLYKLYIIDEAHMLSTGAFNALLKTMEEPPTNTIFILATTEAQKIPVTIHSRCQHLSFRKLTTLEITAQLQSIAQQENLTVAEQSLQTIAKNATGCMRDAISLLDQIYSFAGNQITQEHVLMILGSANFAQLFRLLSNFLTGEREQMLTQLNELLLSGLNINQLLTEFTELLLQLIFCRLQLQSQLDLDEASAAQLTELAGRYELALLQNLLEAFAKTEMDLRYFPDPELLLKVRFLTLMPGQSVPVKPPLVIEPTLVLKPVAAAPKPTPIPAPKVAQSPRPAVATPTSNVAWQAFLQILQTKSNGLFLILKPAKVLAETATVVEIALQMDFAFQREKILDQNSQQVINTCLRQAYQQAEIKLVMAEPKAVAAENTEVSEVAMNIADEVLALAPKELSNEQHKINQIIALFEAKRL